METLRYYELKADNEQALADDLGQQIVRLQAAQEHHQHLSQVFQAVVTFMLVEAAS